MRPSAEVPEDPVDRHPSTASGPGPLWADRPGEAPAPGPRLVGQDRRSSCLFAPKGMRIEHLFGRIGLTTERITD
jgi:hypothetical protein